MGKKYLGKSEFRMDLNPLHKNPEGENHPAYISAKHGHKYKANTITHAEIIDNETTLKLDKNPNFLSKDKRQSRLSPPFWQSEKQFGKEKLSNFRFSKQEKKKIRKYNKKFKK